MPAAPDRGEQARCEAVAGAGPDGGCRAAADPSGIPGRGWREALRRTLRRVFEARLPGEAAAVAFYALFALFPATAALAWLLGLLADPTAAERLRGAAPGALPAGAAEVVGELLARLAARPGGGLGTVGGLAAAGAALWSATAAAAQLFGALNAAYGEREDRSPRRLYGAALLFAIGAGAFVVAASAAVIVPAALGARAGPGSGIDAALRFGRWPVLLVAVSLGLAAAYRYGPSRACPRWRWVSWGGALAALAWLLASAAFSFYVERVGGYDRVYGSLGAVAGLMTWAWLSSAAVLAGAAFNAELEREAAAAGPTG